MAGVRPPPLLGAKKTIIIPRPSEYWANIGRQYRNSCFLSNGTADWLSRYRNGSNLLRLKAKGSPFGDSRDPVREDRGSPASPHQFTSGKLDSQASRKETYPKIGGSPCPSKVGDKIIERRGKVVGGHRLNPPQPRCPPQAAWPPACRRPHSLAAGSGLPVVPHSFGKAADPTIPHSFSSPGAPCPR